MSDGTSNVIGSTRQQERSRKLTNASWNNNKGESWGVADIRVTDDQIFVAFGYDLPEGHSHPAVTSGLWDCEALVAMDKQSGKQLWVKYPKQRYNIHAIAAGEGVVFVTDSIAPLAADELSRRGTLPKTMPSTTYALDAAYGREEMGVHGRV